MKFAIMILLLLGMHSHPLVAQDSLPFPEPNASFFKSAGKDLIHTATFPKYLRKSDLPLFIAGITAPLIFLPADETVTSTVYRNQQEGMLNFCKYGLDPWGSGLYTLPVFGITWVAGKLANDERTAWVGMQGGKATVLAMLVSRVPKYIFQRQSPVEDDLDAYRFEGPFNGFTGNYSFPSGHTFIAFSAVSAIAPELQDKPWLVAGMYTLAGAVGAGRVYQAEHWMTDVIGGAVAGYFFGRFIWRLDNWKVSKKPKVKVFN